MSEIPPGQSRWRRFERALPVILFFFALGLRLLGIGWGLPNERHLHSFHPDEPLIFAYSQTIEPARFDFTPGFYNYGTLYLTLLRISSDVVRAYGGGGGDDMASQIAAVRRSQLSGRVLSAAAGAGTVSIVYLILLRLAGSFGALLGALLVMLAPGHVVHSRFQTVDVLATFLLALSLLFALQRLQWQEGGRRQSWWPSLWAGAFAGLSAGTKITGILALLALGAAVALGQPARKLRDFVVALVAALVAFIVATPGALLETSAFLRDVSYEMTHTSTGHGLVFVGHGGFGHTLLNLFQGLGVVLTVLGTVGLGWACWRRQPWALALAAFALVYAILIMRGNVFFLRYTFPLYIPLALGFGWLMGRAHEKKGWYAALVAAGIVGLGGLDGAGLMRSASMTGWMMSEDPREVAARYLEANAVEVGLASVPWFYTPPLFLLANAGPYVPLDARVERADGGTLIFTPEGERPRVLFRAGQERYDWNVDLLNEAQPDHVVFSSFEMEHVERLRNAQGLPGEIQVQVDRYRAFVRILERDYELVARFGPSTVLVHDLQYIRPILWVWKRKPTS